MQPRAAYIHVPFCRHRCGYCNFTVLAGRDDLMDAYLAAVERELSWLARPRQVHTLYLGGGTPTRLSLGRLERLLSVATYWFELVDDYELTVEANPADLSNDVAGVLADFRVTRISLGAQSFHSNKLRLLERDHTAIDIVRAVELARRHCGSISIDLIFGAPGDTLPQWQEDVNAALDLAPDHLAIYGLTFEKGTQFYNRLLHGELSRTDDQLERDMYVSAIDQITASGLVHYEISQFARPGHRSRHNQVYWTGGGYYAAGPGATRYVDGCRQTNHRSTTTYLKRVMSDQSPVAETESLNPEEAARERLVFGLCMLEGVDVVEFANETGYRVDDLAGRAVRRYTQLGLLETDGQRLRLTRNGLLVSDSMWPELLDVEGRESDCGAGG